MFVDPVDPRGRGFRDQVPLGPITGQRPHGPLDVPAVEQILAISTAQFEDLNKREQRVAAMDAGVFVTGGVGIAALITGIVLRITGEEPGRYNSYTTVPATSLAEGDGPAPGTINVVAVPGGIGVAGEF